MNYLQRSKKHHFFFGGGGQEGGGGAGEGVCWGQGVKGCGAGVDEQTDEQAQTNLLLQFLRRWGHYNA